MSKKKLIVIISIASSVVVIALTFLILFLTGVFTPKDKNSQLPTTSSTEQTIKGINSSNFENRIYIKGSSLYGDETANVTTLKNTDEDVDLSASNILNFNTETVGKKLAIITYGGKEIKYPYYVLESYTDKSLNCISEINNLFKTYYVYDLLTLEDVTITFVENKQGYMVKTYVPVTDAMISGFTTTNVGTRKLKINYNGHQVYATYNVKERSTDLIKSENFSSGKYYATAATEETTHFIINIAPKTYVAGNYKEIIEKVYAATVESAGISATGKITIELNSSHHPSCGGSTIYINSNELFLTPSSSFIHELAHALENAQPGQLNISGTLTEGFAQYVQYLTVKKINETNPQLSAYVGTYESVVQNINIFKDEMHFHDFETVLLGLKGDELFSNSQYEVGARFYAYLNHRYGDFNGWMQDSRFSTSNVSDWSELIKTYYNNTNLYSEFFAYEQLLGDNRNVLCGNEAQVTHSKFGVITDCLDYVDTFNFYFNLSNKTEYQGSMTLSYSNLYLNIDSARDQLRNLGITFSDLSLKTNKHVLLELYNANGQVVKTISNTTQTFSLAGVSFIKFIDSGIVNLQFGY